MVSSTTETLDGPRLDAKDAEAGARKKGIPHGVALFGVSGAVDLDDEPTGEAGEVEHVAGERMLAPEVNAQAVTP